MTDANVLLTDVATVSEADLREASQRLGLTIKEEETEDYLKLMGQFKQSLDMVMSFPDHLPPVDYDVFPRYNIRVPSDAENALKGWATKVSVSGRRGGCLEGKTICLKDNICLAGVPCQFGTDVVSDFVPSTDATIVTRILEAGGNIIGKATCENMSHGAASDSSPGRPVENPYAKGFSAGGSSSGCGALIGSGEVDMGMGGDQGGSVRLPAAFCGLVGLKPTLGLVPYTGVLSSEASVDYVGPMTRTVLDNALLLEIVAGYDGIDDRQLGAPARAFVPHYANDVLSSRRPEYPLMGTRIGILQQGIELPRLQPQVGRLFELAVQRFRHLGAQVTPVSVPRHREILPATTVINKMGSSQTRIGRQCQRRALYLNEYFEKLLPWDQAKWDRAHTYVKNTSLCAEYAWGGACLRYATAYGRAVNQIRKLKEEYDAVLKECDVLIMPTVPFTAKRHSNPDGGPWHTHDHYAGIIANTSQFNGTGHPALSIPMGVAPPMDDFILSPSDKDIRLPVGLQIVGNLWDEGTVYRVADAWERSAGDWRQIEAEM
ncbi:amidase signature enzyme [Schizophyllum commune Tattone D]|nr:amidase signature enzyme [Schizophyllum commune Tattone D]